MECLADAGEFVESDERNRCGKGRLFQRFPQMVFHETHRRDGPPCQDRHARFQRAVPYDKRGGKSALLVAVCFYHEALCECSRVGLVFVHFGNEQNHIKKLIHASAVFCRDGRPRHIAPEFLEVYALLHDGTLCAFNIRIGLVYLIDGNDERDTGFTDLCERFQCLRFHTVVGGDDKYRDVGDICAARAYRGECRVPGCVNKRYTFIDPERSRRVDYFFYDFVGGDMLCDTAVLFCNDVRFADEIKQCGFAVIHVSHHHHDGRTLY